jgi:hypothetical protein
VFTAPASGLIFALVVARWWRRILCRAPIAENRNERAHIWPKRRPACLLAPQGKPPAVRAWSNPEASLESTPEIIAISESDGERDAFHPALWWGRDRTDDLFHAISWVKG